LTTILIAIITVLAWGTWIAPMQNVQFKSQRVKTFYVACANLILTLTVTLIRGYEALPAAAIGLSFAGGVVWAVSGLCAFSASAKIGLARAFGIWAPLNIVMGLLWGGLLFHEFPDTSLTTQLSLFGSAAVIIAGILLIIFSRAAGSGDQSVQPGSLLPGLLAAVGAGVLWGTYFVPVEFTGVSPWAASLPMALGILAGSLALVLIGRDSLALPLKTDYLRTTVGGVLWGIGNYGMLLLVERVGAGRGFTIAQLSLVIGALISIFWLKDPPPQTKAARLTFLGCVLAMAGGIALGNLK
jgi:glucose uptake protein